MNLSSGPPNLWTERYETLRRHFVENRQFLEADPLDLTLLLRNGIAGWMRRWSTGTQTTPQPKVLTALPWSPPTPAAWQQDLTRLIAHMTSQHLQTSSRL